MSRRPGGRRPRPRPDRWLGPATGTIGLLVVWGAVAHASGSGWVQALAALAAGVAAVGMLGPWLSVRRLRLAVAAAPADATSGADLTISVVASGACRCTPLRPGGEPVHLVPGRPGNLVLRPDRRGVLRAVEVKVQSAAPFGLLWWSARRRLELPRSVVIAPGRSRGRTAQRRGEKGASSSEPARLAEDGERRGSRGYRVGDSRRKVDWRATAHTGSLMVRESDASLELPVRVVAELADDPDLAETQAGEAMGAVASLLEAGRPVVLETAAGGGRAAGRVASEREAGRRLARAGRNPWADLAPEGDGS